MERSTELEPDKGWWLAGALAGPICCWALGRLALHTSVGRDFILLLDLLGYIFVESAVTAVSGPAPRSGTALFGPDSHPITEPITQALAALLAVGLGLILARISRKRLALDSFCGRFILLPFVASALKRLFSR